MPSPLKRAISTLALLCSLGLASSSAMATPITYEFSGVFRFPFYPGHPIHQGDTYHGRSSSIRIGPT